MTNIEKIRVAREKLTEALKDLHENGYRLGAAGFQLRVQATDLSVNGFIAIQTHALVQATQVADENFERAQKLSEQLQENVKHIELMAKNNRDLIQTMESAGFSVLRNPHGEVSIVVWPGRKP